MDFMTATVLIASTLGAIMIHLVSSELYGFGAALARKLIELAAARVPERDQERYREEWLAHYEKCPGTFAKLWHAMGCMSAASALVLISERRETAAMAEEIAKELDETCVLVDRMKLCDLNDLPGPLDEKMAFIEAAAAGARALRREWDHIVQLGPSPERIARFQRQTRHLRVDLETRMKRLRWF